MQILKRVLFILAVALSCGAFTVKAQEVIVRTRPIIPHYERVPAPGPRHVWIEEEWEPRNGAYVFVGGHWAEPPHEGWIWIPGHWKETPRGSFWVRGHWRRR